MTDIAKCHGERCPDRHRCCRYTAPWGEWQAWCAFDRERKPGKDCERFWPVIERQPKVVKTKGVA